MRVAILSAGPSLAATFNPDAHADLRIGVNSAVAAHYCDWWACGDGQTFARVTPIGLPALFTMAHDDGQVRQRRQTLERWDKHRRVLWSEVAERVRPPACWSSWSITAALALAVDQGAKNIEVFGHDMQGTIDVAGHDLPLRAENWKRVAADWAATRDWAEGLGLRIEEHRKCT